VWQVGDLIVEYAFERRRIKDKEDTEALVGRLGGADAGQLAGILGEAPLTKRQLSFATKLATVDGLGENALAAYAAKLLSIEDAHYRRLLAPTDLVTKLGPMFGLLGTLIPLGPGIVALGQGDILALSGSLNVAFDTTIAGVIAAAVCLVISYIRSRWYESYTSTDEAIAEIVVDVLARAEGEGGGTEEVRRGA